MPVSPVRVRVWPLHRTATRSPASPCGFSLALPPNTRSAGRDEDRVAGRKLGPALRAVAVVDIHVVLAKRLRPLPGLFRQRMQMILGVTLARDASHRTEHTRIAHASSDDLMPDHPVAQVIHAIQTGSMWCKKSRAGDAAGVRRRVCLVGRSRMPACVGPGSISGRTHASWLACLIHIPPPGRKGFLPCLSGARCDRVGSGHNF